MAQMNLSIKDKTHREQTCGCQGGRGEGEEQLGVWGWQMQTITFRMDKQGPTAQHRELSSISYVNHNGREY